MNRKLIAAALLAMATAGCVSTYSYRTGEGGGDYYYAEPSVDVVWWGEPWGSIGWYGGGGWYGRFGIGGHHGGYGYGLGSPWYRGGYGYGGYGFPWYDPWVWQRPPTHRPPSPPPPGPPGPPGTTPPPGVIIGDNQPPIPQDPGQGVRERRPRWWTPAPPEVAEPGDRPRTRPVQPSEPGDPGMPRRVRVAQPGVPAEPGEAPRTAPPGVPSEPGMRTPRPVAQPAVPRAEAPPPRPRGMQPGGSERARPAPMPRSEPPSRPSGGGRMEMREREAGQ